MINSNYKDKTQNLYELFKVDRSTYGQEDINAVVTTLTTRNMYSNLSKDELQTLRTRANTLKDPNLRMYYDTIGEIYTAKIDKDKDLEYEVKKDMKNAALGKTVLFYLISFVMFCVFFASKEPSVIKSVFVIGL